MTSRTIEVAADHENEKRIQDMIREQRDMDIWAAMQSLGGETPIEVTVHRVKPKTWNNKSIEGEIAKYQERITTDDIKESFGGGTYQVQLKAADRKGILQNISTKMIKIAGDPVIDIDTGIEDDSRVPAESSPSIIRDVLKMAESRSQEAEKRAERLMERQDPSIDFLREQVLRLQEQLHEKEERLLNFAERPVQRNGDELLGKFLEGESGRMMALRQQHENELRLKGDMHRDEVNRLNDRFDRMVADLKSSHDREVSNLKHTYDTQIMGLLQNHENQVSIVRASYEGQLEGLKREISHLSRLYEGSQHEIVELRTRKDKSFLEQMTELRAVKEAVEEMGGGNDEPSTLERVLSTVAPAVEGIVNRVSAGAQPPPVQLPPQQMPAQPQVRRLPDGTFETADGRRFQKKPKTKPDGLMSVSDADLRNAIVFFENGLNGNVEPVDFARTAKSIVPQFSKGEFREALAQPQGVDALLARVSKLSPDSNLLTQHGRNWVRKVFAAMLE